MALFTWACEIYESTTSSNWCTRSVARFKYCSTYTWCLVVWLFSPIFFSSLAWGLIFVVVNFSLAAGPCYKNIIQDVGVSSLNLPLKKKKGNKCYPHVTFCWFFINSFVVWKIQKIQKIHFFINNKGKKHLVTIRFSTSQPGPIRLLRRGKLNKTINCNYSLCSVWGVP